jgi:hypothetical protein
LHCQCPLSEVKRTSQFVLQMSAYDPKWTSQMLPKPHAPPAEQAGSALPFSGGLFLAEIGLVVLAERARRHSGTDRDVGITLVLPVGERVRPRRDYRRKTM